MMAAYDALGGQFTLMHGHDPKTGEHTLLAASKEGNVVGGLRWDPKEIMAIDVHPRLRGQGLAGEMLRRAAILHLKGEAPEPLTSETRTAAGQRLHERYGGSDERPPEGYMDERDYVPFYDEDYK